MVLLVLVLLPPLLHRGGAPSKDPHHSSAQWMGENGLGGGWGAWDKGEKNTRLWAVRSSKRQVWASHEFEEDG